MPKRKSVNVVAESDSSDFDAGSDSNSNFGSDAGSNFIPSDASLSDKEREEAEEAEEEEAEEEEEDDDDDDDDDVVPVYGLEHMSDSRPMPLFEISPSINPRDNHAPHLASAVEGQRNTTVATTMTVAAATASALRPSRSPGEDLTVNTAPLWQDDRDDQLYTPTWDGFEDDARLLCDDPDGGVDEEENGVYNYDDEELATLLGELNHIGPNVGLPDDMQPLFPDVPPAPAVITISDDDNDDSNDAHYQRYRRKETMARPKKEGISKKFAKDLAQLSSQCANATEMKDTPSQLNVELLPHQKQALAWMLRCEDPRAKPPGQPLGGILADDQGFGKTLSFISLLLSVKMGRTLIVAPTSILHQWAEELETRVKEEHRLRVLIYHGSIKQDITRAKLNNYDVVITSYGILVQQYPKIIKIVHPVSKKLIEQTRPPGLLFRVTWKRVILDEAQAIKNRMSGSHKAACAVKATHRWAATGTPIQNSVDDLYALLLFLQYYVVDKHADWHRNFKMPLEGANASTRVRERVFMQFQAILGPVLLRRAKHDLVDGKPVVSLPERTVRTLELDFSERERRYYNNQEFLAVRRMNAIADQLALGSGISNALVILLRLRQACNHPRLCEWGSKTLFNFTDEELDNVEQRMRTRGMFLTLPPPVQERLLRELGPDAEASVQTCPVCMDVISEGVVTVCGHVFCHHDFQLWTANGQHHTCPSCRAPLAGENDSMLLSEVRKEVHAVVRRQKREAKKVKREAKKLLQSQNENAGEDDDEIQPVKTEPVDDEIQLVKEEPVVRTRRGSLVNKGKEEDQPVEIGSVSKVTTRQQAAKTKTEEEEDIDEIRPVRRGRRATSSRVVVEEPKDEDEVDEIRPVSRKVSRWTRVLDEELKEKEAKQQSVKNEQKEEEEIDEIRPVGRITLRMTTKQQVGVGEDEIQPSLTRSGRCLRAESEEEQRPRKRLRIKEAEAEAEAAYEAEDEVTEATDNSTNSTNSTNVDNDNDSDSDGDNDGDNDSDSDGDSDGDNDGDGDDYTLPTTDVGTSVKISAFLREFSKIMSDTKDKVLCFSQWTRMLELLQEHLDPSLYVRLDGSQSLDKRSHMVQKFKTDPKCRLFLISLKAGSTGLNLSVANRVFLLDSWWNPAVEDQAIDRVHRLGQTKPVEIVKLRVKETVEDRIFSLQEKKRTIADGALGKEGLKVVGRQQLSMTEILGLFEDVYENVAQRAQDQQDEGIVDMVQPLQTIDPSNSGIL